MTEMEKNASEHRWRNRRLIINLAAGLIVLVSATAGLCAFVNRSEPRVGVELSKLRGVSIVRRGRWHSGQTTNVDLNDRRYSRIYRDGYELLYALCDATDQQYPIVQIARLPAGWYRVSAATDRGGQDGLLRLLSTAYEEAFGLEVAVREIETYVQVMTCPNEHALKLRPSARKTPYFKGDFAEGTNGTGTTRTRYRVEFACGMDNLASYSAYMTRKAYEEQRPAVRDRMLATAIVNETGLSGLYEGEFSWRFYDADGLTEQLEASGLKLTPAKRKIKALVIAPRQ